MSSRLSPNKPWLPFVFLGLAAIGFSDATWLTVKHFTQTVVPCSLTHGCEIVTTSTYSTIFGIPVALLGSIFYFILIIGTFAALESGNKKLFKYITRLTIAGFLASLWFVAAQIFIIHAICQWCMGSAATSTLLFTLSFFVVSETLTPDEVEPAQLAK
jgi:uncharacterized membrane protein